MDALNSLPPKPEPGLRPYLWSLDLLTIIQESKYEWQVSEAQIAFGGQDLDSKVAALGADFKKTLNEKYGVEIHSGDLQLFKEDDFTSFMGYRFTVRWRPTTHAVQFRVGPEEGWIAQVADLGLTVEVPIGQYLSGPDPGIEPFGKVDLVPYRMAGWNEMERCWVFMPVGTLF